MRQQDIIDTPDSGEREITLGTDKLLVLFFALVILCGISLGVGYSLGRNAGKQAAAASAAATQPAAPAPSAAGKPGASQAAAPKAPAPDPTTAADNPPPQPAAQPSTNDLTFYQAVQQKDPHAQLTPQTRTTAPAPAPVRTSLGNGFLVQIAAVSNQDDAAALRDELQKQRYPVVIVSQAGDKLFHVQVGPYADIKEAEVIRTRLLSAGFSNAFIKR